MSLIIAKSSAGSSNLGTVTSIDGSGGTTGLTLTGGPITNSGTLTLGGTLGVVNGGTGLTTLGTGLQALRTNAGATAMEWYTPTIGTVTSVALVSDTTTGLTVVSGSPITTSGTLHIALNSELNALAGLSSLGFISRTNTATYTPRTIIGTTGNIIVSNGDGILGDPIIDLTTITQGIIGTSLVKVAIDAKGRITNNLAVTATDITTLVDSTYVNVSGDTMTSAANLTFSGGGEILGLPNTPSSTTSATSKTYVDSVAAGLDPKESVRVATTVTAGNIPGYITGVITIPNNNNTYFPNVGAASVVDGITLVNGYRVLVKNQTDAKQNGIYVVTTAGVEGTTDAVLTRASDQNGSPASEVSGGNFTFVEGGTSEASTGWVVIGTGILTLDTDPIVWTQFSGTGTYLAQTPIKLTGSTFSLGTLSSYGTANQVIGANAAATDVEYKTLTAGTAISIVATPGVLTFNNTGVTSLDVAIASQASLTVNASTGSITITTDTDLDALASLTTTGLIVRTGTGTATTSTITGTTNQIAITNGSGVSGNPTIAIADNVVLPGTASMTIVTGSTANQPAAGIGQIRYDSTTNQIMWSNSSTWNVLSTGGTVTSVSGSGGTTGLTLTGGPITGSGTLTLGGTLAVANGGTGATTANTGLNALLPTQTSNAGKVLTTDGTNTSWNTPTTGTVTSVSGSGGTTGLTLTGGPITTTGTLTLGGILVVGNGGTGLATVTNVGELYAGNNTTNMSRIAPVASGSILTSAGTSSPPVWSNTPSITTSVTVPTLYGSSSASGNLIISSTSNATKGTITSDSQFISTATGNAVDGKGQIYLNGATSNRIDFNINGVGAPIFTTRSVGTKIVLYPGVSSTSVDFALGIESFTYWQSVPAASSIFKWYAGTTNIMTLNGTGCLGLSATPASDGIGITFPVTQDPSTNVNTLDDYQEAGFTPTITAQTGTLTSVTGISGNYTKIGRIVHYHFAFTISDNGTGAGFVKVTLPVDAVLADIGVGRENAVTGKLLQLLAQTTFVAIRNYDNTYAGGHGTQIIGSIAYHTA